MAYEAKNFEHLLFPLYFGVFFNAGVDVALIMLFGFPLMRGIRNRQNRGT